MKYWYWPSIIWKAILVMILQYVFNTGIQDFIWVFQHALQVFLISSKQTLHVSISHFMLVCDIHCIYVAQIIEQMSGPVISWYEKSILGCWPLAWAGLWNKKVWADYEQLFWVVFSTFHGQIFFFTLKRRH